MKRSDFIKLSAFAAAAINLPLLQSCAPQAAPSTLSTPVFLSRLFDENMLKETGNAYLQKTPVENDQQKLISLLSGNGTIATSTDEKEIHHYLDRNIKNEFESGNTVSVKGWILSVTEARQCALFALVNK